MKLKIISKGLRSREIPRPLSRSRLYHNLSYVVFLTQHFKLLCNPTHHADTPLLAATSRPWSPFVVAYGPCGSLSSGDMLRRQRVTSRMATPPGDPRGVPKFYKRYQRAQVLKWNKIRLVWKTVKTLLATVRSKRELRKLVSAFQGLKTMASAEEFANIDIDSLRNEMLSDLDTPELFSDSAHQFSLSLFDLQPLDSSDAVPLDNSLGWSSDALDKFNREWEQHNESADSCPHLTTSSNAGNASEDMPEEDSQFKLPAGTEIKYWASTPESSAPTPTLDICAGGQMSPTPAMPATLDHLRLPPNSTVITFPAMNYISLDQSSINCYPGFSPSQYHQQVPIVSMTPSPRPEINESVCMYLDAEDLASSLIQETAEPQHDVNSQAQENLPDLLGIPTPLSSLNQSLSPTRSLHLSPATSPITSAWRQLIVDDDASSPEAAAQSAAAPTAADPAPSAPKKKRQYRNYRKMRDDNNRACARYRDTKKMAASRLRQELECLKERNKELKETFNRKFEELSRYNDMMIGVHINKGS